MEVLETVLHQLYAKAMFQMKKIIWTSFFNFKQGNIRIREHVLELRPLITKYKKLILSNVCPIIPHSVIITALNNIDVVTTSQLTFLRAGISEPGFTHILSFRRQVYIYPDSLSKIPESLQINYGDTSYCIYVTTDTLTCFLCKKPGHIAKNCKTTPAAIPENPGDTNPTLSATPFIDVPANI